MLALRAMCFLLKKGEKRAHLNLLWWKHLFDPSCSVVDYTLEIFSKVFLFCLNSIFPIMPFSDWKEDTLLLDSWHTVGLNCSFPYLCATL